MQPEINDKAIRAAYTKANLQDLLYKEINGISTYSHKALADWACDFNAFCIDQFDKHKQEDEMVEAVVLDIDTQWDLWLSNSYTVEELRETDMSKIRLPIDLFESWFRLLK